MRLLEQELEAAGYRGGTTTSIGRASARSPRYFLPRLPVNDCDDDRLFMGKIDGHYDWLATAQGAFRHAKHWKSWLGGRDTDDEPGLAIIIVNWNSKDYVARCVESIARCTLDINHEIVVIDSGSFDGCGELLGRIAPSARFIQNADNVGFAAANNIAARTSRSEWLLFLNPDTEVSPDAIQQLLDASRSLENAGILGTRLLNTDGTLQTSCVMPFHRCSACC